MAHGGTTGAERGGDGGAEEDESGPCLPQVRGQRRVGVVCIWGGGVLGNGRGRGYTWDGRIGRAGEEVRVYTNNRIDKNGGSAGGKAT